MTKTCPMLDYSRVYLLFISAKSTTLCYQYRPGFSAGHAGITPHIMGIIHNLHRSLLYIHSFLTVSINSS